jgi:hypothetical protein
VLISHIVVCGLKTIIEHIAGAIVEADSIQDFHIQFTASQKAFQNFEFKSLIDIHQLINLLIKLRGHSQVNI